MDRIAVSGTVDAGSERHMISINGLTALKYPVDIEFAGFIMPDGDYSFYAVV